MRHSDPFCPAGSRPAYGAFWYAARRWGAGGDSSRCGLTPARGGAGGKQTTGDERLRVCAGQPPASPSSQPSGSWRASPSVPRRPERSTPWRPSYPSRSRWPSGSRACFLPGEAIHAGGADRSSPDAGPALMLEYGFALDPDLVSMQSSVLHDFQALVDNAVGGPSRPATSSPRSRESATGLR